MTQPFIEKQEAEVVAPTEQKQPAVEGWAEEFEKQFRRKDHMVTIRDGEILHPIEELTDFIHLQISKALERLHTKWMTRERTEDCQATSMFIDEQLEDVAEEITKAKEEERREALTQAWQKIETDIRAKTVQHAVEQAIAICRSLLPTGDNKQGT